MGTVSSYKIQSKIIVLWDQLMPMTRLGPNLPKQRLDLSIINGYPSNVPKEQYAP